MLKEAQAFVDKAQALMTLEQVENAMLCVFSAGGFFKNTLTYLTEHQIAYTNDPRWLEYHLWDNKAMFTRTRHAATLR